MEEVSSTLKEAPTSYEAGASFVSRYLVVKLAVKTVIYPSDQAAEPSVVEQRIEAR